MKDNKLVSIITPAYNTEKYIAQTIESVQKQTYKNWEMIIVDDCSQDDTVKIVEEYAKKDSRIILLKNCKNSGVSFSRNQALKHSQGDYIAFLDSDDLWIEDKLEKQINFMKDNNYVLTYTAYQKFNSKTGMLGKVIKVPKKMTYKKIFYNTAIACLTVMVNREVVGDFEMPLLDHTEDQCTWQEILKRGFNAYGLNENLSIYRVGTSSLTSNKKKAVVGQWKTYRDYYKLSLQKSILYFSLYALNALIKHGGLR